MKKQRPKVSDLPTDTWLITEKTGSESRSVSAVLSLNHLRDQRPFPSLRGLHKNHFEFKTRKGRTAQGFCLTSDSPMGGSELTRSMLISTGSAEPPGRVSSSQTCRACPQPGLKRIKGLKQQAQKVTDSKVKEGKMGQDHC